MNRHPVIVSYRSVDDLKTLKDWFYNFNESRDHRLRAIQRVKALSTRGRLPHGIESTALLTSICLQELNKEFQVDSYILRLSYSSAIIRFVNGLLDPFQQSTHAIPLHHLAKTLNLPGFFVELRHMSTHENLPSLEICQIACERALNWLYDNYWCHIEDEEDDNDDEQSSEEDQLSESTKLIIENYVKGIETFIDKSQINPNLKTYKRIRKQNLDLIYKLGDSSTESAIKYTKAIKDIKKVLFSSVERSYSGTQILILTLVFKNFLIYNSDKLDSKKLKFNSLLIKLYKPLLNDLGIPFKVQLILTIISIISNYFGSSINNNEDSEDDENDDDLKLIIRFVNSKLGFEKLVHSFEVIQLLEWLSFMVVDVLDYDNKTTIGLDINRRFNLVNINSVTPPTTTTTIASRNGLLKYILVQLHTLYEKIPTDNQDFHKCFIKIYGELDNCCTNHKIIKNIINKSNKEVINESYKKIKNVSQVRQTYELPPSLDEILGDTTTTTTTTKRADSEPPIGPSTIKRSKLNQEKHQYLFEPYDTWEPTPFGTFV
ncbi:Las1-like-domain-containing protein [Scheffersomyces amazonensis]|uniref:Las1-like-domain-containing protein n=1 Tax=Scheffersomyces amazonensis TaxID=1078765 RepID=UPI00315CB631